MVPPTKDATGRRRGGERFGKIVALVVGVLFLLPGLWAFVAPASFFASGPAGGELGDEPEAAQLPYLEVVPQAGQGAVDELVLAGVHAAGDAGARWIEHRIDGVESLGAGLRWQTMNGVRRLDTTEVP